MSKDKIQLSSLEEAVTLLERLTGKYLNENITTIDGLRIDFENSWVIIRKSNTEPIIRIYSEARSQKEATELSDKLKNEILSMR